MKAIKTFYIGLAVTLIGIVQLIFMFSAFRFVTIAVGLFFMIFGWKIGWTRHRNLTVLLGHLAVVTGCLVCAYGFYQLPFLKAAPTLLQVIDMPLFWGLFTLWGGNCMITHGFCSCAINMNIRNNEKKK